MNKIATYVWLFFIASLTFGIWIIPMLLVWTIGCYIYWRWEHERNH